MSGAREDSVERIVALYTETRMTVPKFKQVVEEELAAAEARGALQGGGMGTYDQGFQDGYEAHAAEGTVS